MFSKALKFMLATLSLVFAVGVVCSCGKVDDGSRRAVDSLNVRAYDVRYTDVGETRRLVNEMVARYAECEYLDGLYEGLINKGFVHYMQMRYDSVRVCCEQVLDESDNQLLCAMADVTMMAVCNMTGQSREFYGYRSDALDRMAKVAEEQSVMTEHQRDLWNKARTQFHLVSLKYFVRMRQGDEVSESAEWLDDNSELFAHDSTLLLSHIMLKSMLSFGQGEGEEPLAQQRQGLVRMLQLSYPRGYVFLTAEAMNRLARSIVRNGELNVAQQAFVRELIGIADDADVGEALAERALELFEQYGNYYTISRAMITLSEYKLRNEEYAEAIDLLDRALFLVNKHHREVNENHRHGGKGMADVLYTYAIADDSMSTEMMWVADDSIIAVPDWMAAVREQLSVAYGAMGLKAESDYNHNIYFDILDATRQDQRVLQEKNKLSREESNLNWLILMFVAFIIVMVWVLYAFNRKSEQLYRQRVGKFSEVIDVCRNMARALSDEIEDETGLDEALHELTDDDVRRLFPEACTEHDDWTLADARKLKSGMDREMLSVLQVFFRWMREKGLMYIEFADEERRLESETYALGKRFEESKKQYIEKLTSMGIVNGMTPFIDRAIHAMSKLRKGEDGDEAKERLRYVGELIDKINEYNDVLGHWVKIRRGLVTLNAESFALQPLLDTLSLSVKTFANKGIALSISNSDAVVKADKALTLFMMNTLLDNARKYTPEGGKVVLRAEELSDCVEISVEDTGHGMSAEDVVTLNGQKVYDSGKIGVSGKNAEAVRQQKGFGFGLMNCKGIIETYRKTSSVFSVCQFGVESEEGKGSRFFFRLPKGVMKALAVVAVLLAMPSCSSESEVGRGDEDGSQRQQEWVDDSLIAAARSFADSVYAQNVAANYERAIEFADSAIECMNAFYLKQNPQGDKLMTLDGGDMAEVDLWREGFVTDYDLIVGIRNEVAISALALNRNHLYRYNSEIHKRIYKLASTDEEMEEYCSSIREANKNRKTVVVMLVLVIVVVLATYFFLYYRRYQLFVFNLRQLIDLNNKVFSASGENLSEVLQHSLSDIKQTENVELSLGELTVTEQMRMKAMGENLRLYPLTVKTADEEVNAGVMSVLFRDGNLTEDEELIMDYVRQFVAIHTYFSHQRVGEQRTQLELKEDERRRVEMEEQKVHVQNMIMDNCMSALKHETMYYPNRIKQIADMIMLEGDETKDRIAEMDELLIYYKNVFTILSACAEKQVERVLFKRSSLPAKDLGDMAMRMFRKINKKASRAGAFAVASGLSDRLRVMGDSVFLQVLVSNVLSLYFEHSSGGDLTFSYEDDDEFVRFSFADSAYRYDEKEIPLLFYVDSVKYDAREDRLIGIQYLLAKQVIREHDRYSSRRGCRIYVENDADGNGSRFVFTLQKG